MTVTFELVITNVLCPQPRTTIMHGKNNSAVGFLIMGGFMLYGFLLIYLRDFAPDKQAWVDSCPVGKHFESRLAQVRGNRFAVLNVIIWYLQLQFHGRITNTKAISYLALAGLLMPVGILAEVYIGAPPVLVLVGAIAMTVSMLWLGVAFVKLEPAHVG